MPPRDKRLAALLHARAKAAAKRDVAAERKALYEIVTHHRENEQDEPALEAMKEIERIGGYVPCILLPL
jgi:hypothetical protein